jgi:hypothetical protein
MGMLYEADDGGIYVKEQAMRRMSPATTIALARAIRNGLVFTGLSFFALGVLLLITPGARERLIELLGG